MPTTSSATRPGSTASPSSRPSSVSSAWFRGGSLGPSLETTTAQQLVLPGEALGGQLPQPLDPGEQRVHTRGVPGGDVGVEVAQAEVVAGVAVAHPHQVDRRLQREAQVQRHRLREVTALDGPVHQPLAERSLCADLRHRLLDRPSTVLLVVVALDDEPVRVEEDDGCAVPTYVL